MSEQSAEPEGKRPRFTLIVTIEGLGTNLVGCYGGAIAPTKNWDSFACRSIVFDQFWTDALLPADVLNSLWTGTPHARPLESSDGDVESPLTAVLEQAMLVTDSMDAVEGVSHEAFGRVVLMEHDAASERVTSSEDEPSTNEHRTQFQALLEAALGEWATQLDALPILWIHSKGLNGPWDAPYANRLMMCDEEDPLPPTECEPANFEVTSETDPDEIFGWACAMGGQAIAFDDSWSMVEEILGQLGIERDCLQILAGIQGYPIGEHGWIGHAGNALYAESLHLPLIVRPGNQLDVGVRVPFMVQPNSLLKTIASWIGQSSPSTATDLVEETAPLAAEQWPLKNQIAYASHEDQVHLAVPAWSCRWSRILNHVGQAEDRVELFATPDDRWQQNEVSQRAASIVDELTVLRNQWLESVKNPASERTPLSSDLTHPMR